MFSKIFKITINIILLGLIIIGIFVVFSFVSVPGNYKIFTVQSGSMEPAIKTGSLIFVKSKADYNVGDVVTKKMADQKMTVTHRIFAKEEIDGKTVFTTKGDANNAPDSEKFTKAEIIGKEILAIPFLGYLVSYAKTSKGMILLVIIPAVIIIYDEINKIKTEIKKKISLKNQAKREREIEELENEAEKNIKKIKIV